jgi:PhnB protein
LCIGYFSCFIVLVLTDAITNIAAENVDKIFNQAISAGATTIFQITDMFWGDRYGQLMDPYGHFWSIATHKEDLSNEEERRGCM